jgi:hypothetical protein
MVTGRRIAEEALRAPMTEAGWQTRAAGWFTRSVDSDQTGVIALGVTSKHKSTGSADVTAYVGLRVEAVETVVADICESTPTDYRERTAVSPLGYLMPGARWRDWHIDTESAAVVASELCAAVESSGLPWLRALATDADALLAQVKASPAFDQATGLTRYAVLLAQSGRVDDALGFITQRAAALEDRSDPAAEANRRATERLRGWLDSLG